MFLEEKLETFWQQNIERKARFDVSTVVAIDLLNTCLAHIKEHIKVNDTWSNLFAIVKQTDNIWRTFAKKKGFSENFFRANHIIPRLKNKPGAKEYFKITKEEIEKYGQEQAGCSVKH